MISIHFIQENRHLESERDLYKGIVTVLSDFSLPAKRDNGIIYYGKIFNSILLLYYLIILIILANRKNSKRYIINIETKKGVDGSLFFIHKYLLVIL